MNISKKLLSLFLAVVMLVSVFTVMTSAYTVGAEVAGAVNYKYTVEKVDSIPETAAGSVAWSADNIYAVTVWMQSDMAVENATAPIHYNKAHFAPITLSDGDCTYPAGAGLDQDTYYTDMGEGAIYAYTEGDYLNNTGMYKANGDAATTKALAKCIGLGNANSAGVTIKTEYVSPDHPFYASWSAGIPENTGVVYVNLDVVAIDKTAYLNCISGIEVDTNWNRLFTLYFETLEGVTDADVVGDEFGVYTTDAYGVDASCDNNGKGYYVGATSRVSVNPDKNVVSNAVVEEAAEPSPVYAKGSQIRFNETEANGTGSANFDVRTRAAMTAEDFAAICGTEEVAADAITDVGFVYAASTVAFDLDTAKAVATGTAADGYKKVPVTYIQSTGTEYVWTCLITYADGMYDGAVNSLAYITVNGETYYFDAAYATDFSDLYDTWYDDYTASLTA